MIDFELFELPAYSVFVMLGIATGVIVANLFLRAHSRRVAAASIFFSGALISLMAGWLGARLYHAATHWEYYSTRPEEIAQIGLGGLAMRGALLTGFIGLAVFARVRGLRLARLLDATGIGLSAGQAIGWIGALLHGANYAVVSDSQFALDLPDLYGLYAPRFPLQHAQIILFAGLFVGLVALSFQCPPKGLVFAVYLLVASLANFLLGFQRGDEALFVGGWRVDQWVDLGWLVVGLVAWVAVRAREKLG